MSSVGPAQRLLTMILGADHNKCGLWDRSGLRED